jgi:hypothetical protein
MVGKCPIGTIYDIITIDCVPGNAETCEPNNPTISTEFPTSDSGSTQSSTITHKNLETTSITSTMTVTGSETNQSSTDTTQGNTTPGSSSSSDIGSSTITITGSETTDSTTTSLAITTENSSNTTEIDLTSSIPNPTNPPTLERIFFNNRYPVINFADPQFCYGYITCFFMLV